MDQAERSKTLRILMVERSPFLRFVLREVLYRANHETVGECEALGEAAVLAKRLEPDVVLMELDEPREQWHDHIEVLRQIAPLAKLIAIGPPGLSLADTYGLTAMLSKPCTPEAVLAAIRCDATGEVLPA